MRISRVLVGLCVLGISSAVLADSGDPGWTFVPSIGYQQKQLNFDQSFTDNVSLPLNENGHKSNFSVNLPTANLSLTAANKKIYAVFKYEQSLTEGTVDVDETLSSAHSGPGAAYYLNVPGHETQVKRNDTSITVGMNVWEGMNVFMGYMQGKTKLVPEPTCALPIPAWPFCTMLNLAVDLEQEGLGEYHQTYTEKGPYVGVSYGWQIGDIGTLSASFAYASMAGDFRDNYIYSAGDKHFDFAGDSVGTSFGLNWTVPLGESLAGFIDLRQQRYSMHGKDHNTPSTKFDAMKVRTDETMRGLTLGVQRFF